jgi:hypothetical protein
MKSAQHKQKIGLQGFKHAAVMIIRVPGDTLAFSPRLAAGGCSSLSVEGGVCRFIAARGSEPTIIAHAAEPLASCGALPSAVRASLLAALPQAHCDSILMMNRFNGQVEHAKEMVRKLRAALADANLASTVAVPAGPFDRANTPWQAAALCDMLHAPTEVNVLRSQRLYRRQKQSKVPRSGLRLQIPQRGHRMMSSANIARYSGSALGLSGE